MADAFPTDFFTAPALQSLPAGVYAVVTRRPFTPFTLGTSFFCEGLDCCKWTPSYADAMNTKIAIDPDEPEHRREISRGIMKEVKSFVANPNFIGPPAAGCVAKNVALNVIHFKSSGSGRDALEHALVIGPCSMKDYGATIRALGLIGIDKDHVTMSMNGGVNIGGEE